MPVRMKEGLIVVTADDTDAPAWARWADAYHDHVFVLRAQDRRTFVLHDLGPRADACREPINVISTSRDPSVRLISNLAHTPFVLEGSSYASVEAFWQALKFPAGGDRARVATLHGQAAKLAGRDAPAASSVEYRGQTYQVGCAEHWSLMRQACHAKFTQHAWARDALLGTGTRPLIHRVRRDSRTIPAAIMADIWMRIRAQLAGEAGSPGIAPATPESAAQEDR